MGGVYPRLHATRNQKIKNFITRGQTGWGQRKETATALPPTGLPQKRRKNQRSKMAVEKKKKSTFVNPREKRGNM